MQFERCSFETQAKVKIHCCRLHGPGVHEKLQRSRIQHEMLRLEFLCFACGFNGATSLCKRLRDLQFGCEDFKFSLQNALSHCHSHLMHLGLCRLHSFVLLCFFCISCVFLPWGISINFTKVTSHTGKSPSFMIFISRVSGADIGLPLYPHPSILGGQNLRFTPVPVITDWNHSGCRHP